MSDNSITSIYIPRISASLSDCQIADEFHNFRIGQVRRVDFIPIGKKPGFDEKTDQVVKSAFVHFRHYYYNELTLEIMGKLMDGESHRIYPACGKGEYWVLLKSTNSIPDTMMNAAQIVENCRLLETKVVEQAATIAKLEKETEEKIARIDGVLRQLLGGLFNHTTQSSILNIHQAMLSGEIPYCGELDLENINPTTRQGDDLERRLANLEADMRFNVASNNADELSDNGRLDIDDLELSASVAPYLDDFENDDSQRSHFAELSLEIPEQYEIYDQNCGELHKPSPNSVSSHTLSSAGRSQTPDHAANKFSSYTYAAGIYDYEIECEDSVSTHSSMPDLIPISPETSDNETESRKRARFSCEFCGNE